MTTTAHHNDHLNDRPDWNCRLCGQPWPCASARADLLREFRVFPTVLMIYMSAQMYDALSDTISQGRPAPLNLYERFVTWTRHATV